MKSAALFQPLQTCAISVFAAGVVTLCAWWFVAGPAVARRQEERAFNAEAIARRRELPKLTAQLTLARRQADDTRHAIEQSRLTLLPFSSLNERLAQLSDLAAACGVALDEVRPGVAADATLCKTLPIRLSGSATYPNCADFLHRLHEEFPDISLKSMQANGATAATKSAGPFQIELIWYAATAAQ